MVSTPLSSHSSVPHLASACSASMCNGGQLLDFAPRVSFSIANTTGGTFFYPDTNRNSFHPFIFLNPLVSTLACEDLKTTAPYLSPSSVVVKR